MKLKTAISSTARVSLTEHTMIKLREFADGLGGVYDLVFDYLLDKVVEYLLKEVGADVPAGEWDMMLVGRALREDFRNWAAQKYSLHPR